MSSISKVGLIGAGAMGQGIAQVCAQFNFQVLLFDVDSKKIESAISSIAKNLEVAIAKGKLSIEKKIQTLQNIQVVGQLENMKADLVIEAAVEKIETKQEIFSQLEKISVRDCIFATNTSSLSVSKIASVLNKPSRFLGLHFFNPAHLMPLVEVIAGEKTDAVLLQEMISFTKAIGKTPVVAKDSPGFIVNRVARHYYLETLKALEEHAADAGTIDALLKSAGFKLGPFELMDMIGNDVNYEVSRSLYEAFNHEPRFKPSAIQQQKVKNGELGKKTGKGFYEYNK
jgi:3-hydroxybutyryl-CoA dehydrogenase